MAAASIKYFCDTVRLLWQSLDYARNGEAEDSDIRRWLSLCTEAINSLEKLIVNAALSRAEKQRCQTCMTQLLNIQHQLQQFLRRGGELRQESSPPPPPPPPPAPLALSDVNVEQRNQLVRWSYMPSAFKKRIRSGVITNLGHLDIIAFLEDAETLFESHIATALNEYNSLKVNTELSAEYAIEKNDSVEAEIKYFSTENAAIQLTTDLKEWFNVNVRQVILRKMEEFEEKGSGWSLRSILSLVVNINKFTQLRGSSFIELPKSIQNKRACVNVRNTDDKCFMWAILSALHPQSQHSYRVSAYQMYQNELNFDGIDFPVPLKQIKRFERQNDISVNVYILKKYGNSFQTSPCHVTSSKKEKHVNLLLIQDHYIDEHESDKDDDHDDDDDENIPIPRFHYVWIKSLSALVRKQLTKCKRQCFICDRCLQFFMTHEKLTEHIVDCEQMNAYKIKLPKEGENILSFKNYNRKLKVPFVIYADFECLLKPVEDDARAFQQHQAYSIGYYLKCNFDNRRSMYHSYRQVKENETTPAEWFIENLKILSDEMIKLYETSKPMILTDEAILDFRSAETCHICDEKFTDKNVKVRDHCHFTGKYRGAAHNRCNINYKEVRFIPVVFHNLTGYDSHFIIKEIASASNFKGRVKLIAENKERYISFTKHVAHSDIQFRFIDSFRFMASSLEKLASYLDKLDITVNVFQSDDGYSSDQIKLLLRKGVFPYDYVSSLDKLKEAELPSKNDFYSKLYESGIDQMDYDHAREVWNKFDMKSLGEYSDLYLKTDVLLLADVFENFRTTCIAAYGLDPAHYHTTPGLTWDAMLKYTRVELELLTNVDKLMFVERGIRGGISQCSNRYAKANNEYMIEGFNANEEKKYLMYYDANNLYGWAMTQCLPEKNFVWMEDTVIENFNVLNVPDDNPTGYILEVDLAYPPSLHDQHNDLPFCCEHVTPPGSKQHKLLTTLYDKKRYIIHYRSLKQALRQGLILERIHRVLCFTQRPWLKPYVELNTEKRKQAKNEFEKLFFKLLINAVYGKTMENERKRVDVKLVHKWKGRYSAEALIAKPNFHSRSIFDENLVAVQLSRTEVEITKPIYVGLTVLDVSKTLIYDFHYCYMKSRIGDKCKLLYTDTDSLIYEIRDINMYDVMKSDIDRFDTSDYPENNQYGMPRCNKKIVGLMKDECNGSVMLEFIGLRSKMYSIRIQNERPIKKAKGVKDVVVKRDIDFEDYRNCLFNRTTKTCEQNSIRSRLHIVRTETQLKIALSPHDDKRYLLPNTTDTLSWGHYRILLDTDDDDEDLLLAEAAAAAEQVEMEVEEPIRDEAIEYKKRDDGGQSITSSDIGSREPERKRTKLSSSSSSRSSSSSSSNPE